MLALEEALAMWKRSSTSANIQRLTRRKRVTFSMKYEKRNQSQITGTITSYCQYRKRNQKPFAIITQSSTNHRLCLSCIQGCRRGNQRNNRTQT